MDIRFKVNETNYKLSSDSYQIILSEVKIVKNGKTAGEEVSKLIGYFKNEFDALRSVYNNEKYNSECKSLMELEKFTKATLERLNELMEIYSLRK